MARKSKRTTAKVVRARPSKISRESQSFMTRKGGIYEVRLPSMGGQVLKLASEDDAKVISEAEALRQKLSSK